MSGESNSDQHSDGKALHDDVRDTRPTNRWALWSASGSDGTPEWHELIHYWFVQYNPLYFFSAFCVLAGVSLLALEIDGSAVGGINRDWSLAQVFLFAVIQSYELLLIAAAGFLVHKIGLMRPAVILMFLEGLFLFDCTFRLETISHLGLIGTVLSIVWVILVPIKTWLLGVALRIHIPKVVIWILAGGAAGIALMLQTLGVADVDRSMIILIATWWGAGLFAIAVIVKPRIFQPGSPEGATEAVCRRIAKSLLILLGGVYFYHVFNYVIWVGLDDGLIINPMIGTAFLMVALLRTDEREIWAGTALSLVAAFLYPPATFRDVCSVHHDTAVSGTAIGKSAICRGCRAEWVCRDMGTYLDWRTAPTAPHMVHRRRRQPAWIPGMETARTDSHPGSGSGRTLDHHPF